MGKIRIKDLPVMSPSILTDQDIMPISDAEGLTTYKLSLSTLKDNIMVDVQAVADTKEDIVDGAAETVVHTNLSNSKAVVSDANGKIIASNTTSTEIDSLQGLDTSISMQAHLDLKADLDSPTLTGNPTAPTANWDDDDTTIATTAFVKSLMSWDGSRLKIKTPDGIWRQVYPAVFGD